MQKIVVNDTNVFIDLLEIGLLDYFFQLSWEVYTTDFVMFELIREGQQEAVSFYQKSERLHVVSFGMDELCEIRGLHKIYEHKTNVTLTDCSVWYYAKREGYILLTGDRKLKTVSMKDGVEVRGILYIFDKLVEETILTPAIASGKLKQLQIINPRLPTDEIEERICLWKGVLKRKEGANE
jgi:rRNA-processing protein FCF1